MKREPSSFKTVFDVFQHIGLSVCPNGGSFKTLPTQLALLIQPAEERMCIPNIWLDEIVECHGIYEKWLSECNLCSAILSQSTSEKGAIASLPNYCPSCGAKVMKNSYVKK